MNGLSTLNIELTSRCNKTCAMCGRRKMEREHPELCEWGDMPLEIVQEISRQVPKDITIQLHNNGEPLLYPYLRQALYSFTGNIRCFNTNGKLLMERANDIIGNLETLTVSVIEKDTESEEQFEIVQRFLEKKGDNPPFMVYRLLGEVDELRWKKLPGLVAKRVLHSPDGSREYRKSPTIPEIGICLDLLTHMAIDRFGNVSICVRFDPTGKLRIGNISENDLEFMRHSDKFTHYLDLHLKGRRSELSGCDQCHYWGVPIGC
jgi:sulfatase maturation enzyme AslB (radical SAM superfamily)